MADGKLISTNSKEEPFFFTFGKAELPKGLEMGIGTMTQGEKAIVYARGMLWDGRLIKRRIVDGKGDFPMDCPLHDSLLRVHYEGTLLNEEKTVFYETRVDNNGEPLEFSAGEGLDWTGLNFQEIMDEADKIKATGNKLFKDGNFELAKAKYEKVLREYNHVNPQDEEEGKIFLNSRSNDLFGLFLDETMTYSLAISKMMKT